MQREYKTVNSCFKRWILGLLILSTILTACILSHSSWRGRLQYTIDYEDVITFLDGLKRYRALVDQPLGSEDDVRFCNAQISVFMCGTV